MMPVARLGGLQTSTGSKRHSNYGLRDFFPIRFEHTFQTGLLNVQGRYYKSNSQQPTAASQSSQSPSLQINGLRPVQ
jgi:hypothetical protein